MGFLSLLNLLKIVPAAVAAAPEFVELFNLGKATLSETDQETLQAALEDVQADNDEGHRRLQEKLAAAAAR